MPFPTITQAAWRARIDEDLAGRPFDDALVHATLEGIPVAPLYTEAPTIPRVFGDGAPFRVCVRHGEGATTADLLEDLDGGADALWIPRLLHSRFPTSVSAKPETHDRKALLLVDDDEHTCHLGNDPSWLVSTLDLHARGADACDEIAVALSTVVARLADGTRPFVVRVASGRDVVVELCKLRALRIALRKVFAAGGYDTGLTIHAVASPRTIAARDPWVNMLRVTTELFAAVLGGADLVTPLPFDDALASPSALGRRVARNTGHVLREEASLGRVVDPGAGSYYLDTLTDRIAREAWGRFQAIERGGGIAKAGAEIEARADATRRARQDAVAKRKLAVLGVSEFANLKEHLPSPPRVDAFAAFRDGAAFEALRDLADALPAAKTEVLLATLGPSAESRPRVAFATAFFATGGLRARELKAGEAATTGAIACICGSDARYAAEAVARARALRETGCRHVFLAGRPGALEADLRAAGVDGFLFIGCDAVATLRPLLEVTT